NYQMQMSLEKVAFLPFGYMIDNYRWKIFDGTISDDKLTREWVDMRARYQGIVPAVKRNETDFDPGAKYHVPASTPYIRYFVSFILQFQLHQKFCEMAGNQAVYNCNIGPSAQNPTDAGEALQKLLAAGGSKNWQDLLQEVTGSSKLEAGPIINYFQKLTEFLEEQRKQYNYPTTFNIGNIEDYLGDETLVPPATTEPPPTTEPVPITDPGTGATDPGRDTTDDTTDDSKPSPDEEDENDTVILVIGIVLGVAVVALLGAYFFFKKCRKAK
ncbi:unnamed protein product, partial [Allacma fusca]